jgi:hypothetical protein
VQLSGFDSTKPFTVAFSGQPQTPIRFQSDGTVIIAAPLNIDASTGTTAAFSTTLTIIQNGSTVSSPIVINDLPQLSDLGVSLGVMSRAFMIYQEIVLGQSINAQQAISLLPNAPSSNGTLLANLKTQLLNVIKARNDIDRIVSNNSLSIPVGFAPDGTPISFDINSVTMMDRLFAQYLLATTNDGTVLPQVKDSEARRLAKRSKRVGAFQPLATAPSGFAQNIAGLISTVSGGVSYLSNKQTQTSTPGPSTLDRWLSTFSAASGYVSAGGTVVALLAAGTFPAVATLAGGAAAIGLTVGLVCGALSMGNDYYNLVTNVSALARNEPGSSITEVGKAFASLTSDAALSYLTAEGLGGLNTGVTAAGSSVWKDIFMPLAAAEANNIQLGFSALLVSTDNLLLQKALTDDSNAADSSIQPVNINDLGEVNGTASITNSQGPILSGLTGVGAGNNGSTPDTLTTIAAPDGTYSLVLPLGSPSLAYTTLDIVAFDPVDLYDPSINTLTVLASSVVDLSGVNPNTPITGPSFIGSCNDTDSSNPDGDDPDCD